MGIEVEDRIQALTVEQVAARLQIDVRTCYRLIRRGDIQARKVGRLYRVPLAALDDYLLGREACDPQPLDPDELAAVRRGLDDIAAGRTVDWAELKRQNGL
jgi:excisionase family DNA binding protein